MVIFLWLKIISVFIIILLFLDKSKKSALEKRAACVIVKIIMENLNDEQLTNLAAKGNNEALKTLVARHLSAIYRLAFRYAQNSDDAEDIAQETFVKVWRHLKKFDQTKKFKSWLYQIAKNTGLDWLKKKRAISFSEWEKINNQDLGIENFIDEADAPDVLADKKLLANKLSTAAKQLPKKYAEVVSLRHNQELNFREIAQSLREPLNTVKSRYRRALVLLKKMLIKQ
ncbi:hypothetical protein COU00_01055 [Candidatus Falkowbacteria bacterium CG10_big_fil_rev_8_21_14_0_10_43_11]|uniref:RNA polymerase sigma factor n=1 Tax=Candidatus Falkowbacteria bacterium CG10_big_fil_rev_8_21_14_0_10_43_11 TaxID=1974568 RepID=A0A2M6WMS6_9BACT|nr:MAG: hypothetical protein COU00_01055 [Candidatus Falkowbacteria bacterium CG10_big_fil_rev_8_21_14_0_10_43_11]